MITVNWNDEYNIVFKEKVKYTYDNKLNDSDSADYINEEIAKWVENKLIEAKYHYYETANPIMEDRDYDNFEDQLRKLKPNSKLLNKVGN